MKHINKWLMMILAILLTSGVSGNVLTENFEKTEISASTKIFESAALDGNLIFEFTDKGDGGQLYLSPNLGVEQSAALVATSVSVGSSEMEEIAIYLKENRPFFFESVFIRPGGAPVLVQKYLEGEAVGKPIYISQLGVGSEVKADFEKIDRITVSSIDMVNLAIDGFKAKLEHRANLKVAEHPTQAVEKPTIKKQANTGFINVPEGARKGSVVCYFNEMEALPHYALELAEANVNTFKIDNVTKSLRVANPDNLDCRKPLDHRILVNYLDLTGNVRNTVELTILLTEVNNEAPIITANQGCSITVDQELEEDLELCNISVADYDTEIAQITDWQIVSGNEAEIFNISDKGFLLLSNAKKLQDLDSRVVKLWVRASDGKQFSEVVPIELEIRAIVQPKMTKPAEAILEPKILHWPLPLEEKIQETKMVQMPSKRITLDSSPTMMELKTLKSDQKNKVLMQAIQQIAELHM